MDFLVFCILFFTSILLNIEKTVHSSTLKCSNTSLDITLPVGTLYDQLQQSGLNLVCENNTTKINFPSYPDLIVKSISYEAKKLQLLDPKSCVHDVFLNLDLSGTPFRYYYVVKNYTYLNCSARLPLSYAEVYCLSSSIFHVYTVETSWEKPEFCRAVKTVAIPFSYSPYIRGNTFGLALTWDDFEPTTRYPNCCKLF
ncbi:hypothetical protein ACFE04_020902 [Oxalis oulophora]